VKPGIVSLSALLAISLVSAPVAASAAPVARTGSETGGEGLAGLGAAWLVAAVIVAALVIVVLSDSDEDLPTSP